MIEIAAGIFFILIGLAVLILVASEALEVVFDLIMIRDKYNRRISEMERRLCSLEKGH